MTAVEIREHQEFARALECMTFLRVKDLISDSEKTKAMKRMAKRWPQAHKAVIEDHGNSTFRYRDWVAGLTE